MLDIHLVLGWRSRTACTQLKGFLSISLPGGGSGSELQGEATGLDEVWLYCTLSITANKARLLVTPRIPSPPHTEPLTSQIKVFIDLLKTIKKQGT